MTKNEWGFISNSLRQKKIQNSVVSVLTGLRAGKSTFRIPAETRDIHLLCNIKIGSLDNPASYLLGTRVPYTSKGGWGVGGDKAARTSLRLTTHLRSDVKLKNEWNYAVMHCITFRSMTDRIYSGGKNFWKL